MWQLLLLAMGIVFGTVIILGGLLTILRVILNLINKKKWDSGFMGSRGFYAGYDDYSYFIFGVFIIIGFFVYIFNCLKF